MPSRPTVLDLPEDRRTRTVSPSMTRTTLTENRCPAAAAAAPAVAAPAPAVAAPAAARRAPAGKDRRAGRRRGGVEGHHLRVRGHAVGADRERHVHAGRCDVGVGRRRRAKDAGAGGEREGDVALLHVDGVVTAPATNAAADRRGVGVGDLERGGVGVLAGVEVRVGRDASRRSVLPEQVGRARRSPRCWRGRSARRSRRRCRRRRTAGGRRGAAARSSGTGG